MNKKKIVKKSAIIITAISLVLCVIFRLLDWLYQGPLYMYYSEKYNTEIGLEYKTKGVQFGLYAIDIGNIFFVCLTVTIVVFIICKLVDKQKCKREEK